MPRHLDWVQEETHVQGRLTRSNHLALALAHLDVYPGGRENRGCRGMIDVPRLTPILLLPFPQANRRVFAPADCFLPFR